MNDEIILILLIILAFFIGNLILKVIFNKKLKTITIPKTAKIFDVKQIDDTWIAKSDDGLKFVGKSFKDIWNKIKSYFRIIWEISSL